jgi:hypothetical protein
MKRWRRDIPGYDCLYRPCEKTPPCTPGNSHGIHCEEWSYGVIAADGQTALTLLVYSGIYPRSIPRAHWRNGPPVPEKPVGAGFFFHQAFPSQEEEIRTGDLGANDCELVKFHCYRRAFSILYADEFWQRYAAFINDPSPFWKALEEQFIKWDTAARAERADRFWTRCACCDGKGLVAKGRGLAGDISPAGAPAKS